MCCVLFQTSAEDNSSFEKLISYLRKPYNHHLDSDLYLARAIVVWISNNCKPSYNGTREEEIARLQKNYLAEFKTPLGCMGLLAMGICPTWKVVFKFFR